jgi:hypothetical protein
MPQIRFNPKSNSRGGGTDDPVHENEPVLRTVNVNWNDDGWNVNANSITNPNTWNDDNQVFSRNSCILPSSGGSFRFKSFPPTAQHLADFIQLFRECEIALIIQGFNFPHDMKKELCEVKFTCRFH